MLPEGIWPDGADAFYEALAPSFQGWTPVVFHAKAAILYRDAYEVFGREAKPPQLLPSITVIIEGNTLAICRICLPSSADDKRRSRIDRAQAVHGVAESGRWRP
jgi:hypothetical protein